VDPDNAASLNVARKLGARLVGEVMRDGYPTLRHLIER
jgi:RimJ/RimL family protein N-acetyltransferase